MGYISPEVLLCKQYSYEADYFAVGIIMYFMAFAKFPYKNKERKELIDEI